MLSFVSRRGHFGAILAALLLFVLSSAPAISFSQGAVVGTSSLRLPAVLLNNNTGSLTNFTLMVTDGNGSVFITGPRIVGNSTQQSAVDAAKYASTYLGLNFNRYDFTYHIGGGSENVSGPSGGAGMTVLAISALQDKPLLDTFSMTGTISSTGTIGAVGGVYEKAIAVKHGGLSFFLVPVVGSQSVDDELYLLVQDALGLPIIQVSNVSKAAQFTFTGTNVSPYTTTFSFYNKINVDALPNATFTCSNGCNVGTFQKLTNFTLALTNSSIDSIPQQVFPNVTSQLHASLSQSAAIAKKGYLYVGADYAFLNYADAVFFNNYLTNESTGLVELRSINTTCGALSPQQLTTSNYEYVIGGQLRQAWGLWSINATLSGYQTVETTDDVLFFVREGATASGWCNAANEMFALGRSLGGSDVIPSANLSFTAAQRLSKASSYGPNIYFETAQQAMAAKNYPLAIIDADYAYAISNASAMGGSNITTPSLLSAAASLAANATFGIWATEFANSAGFYAHESQLSSANSTEARAYADSAYSSALLAATISSDMKLINSSLAPGTGMQGVGAPQRPPVSTTTTAQQSSSSNSSDSAVLSFYLQEIQKEVQLIYNITDAFLLMIIVATAIILYFFLRIRKHTKVIARLQKAGRSRGRRAGR